MIITAVSLMRQFVPASASKFNKKALAPYGTRGGNDVAASVTVLKAAASARMRERDEARIARLKSG